MLSYGQSTPKSDCLLGFSSISPVGLRTSWGSGPVDLRPILLWPPYGIGQTIIFLSCFFFLLLSFFPCLKSQWSQVGCLPYFYAWCGPSANLECRSEMCCTRLAGNAGPKKSPKSRHLGTIAQICRAISLQQRYVSTIRKMC